ncbi:ligninase h2 precursor [Colletotrichum sojae]|uniref:Peroxidase n=1 Tax=Colletotrichum sojae TaxID=2175907 RepID=A0A8H6JAG2_9PEZI|nr:ligninase h2 precursor [Colletotrichum sojae]
MHRATLLLAALAASASAYPGWSDRNVLSQLYGRAAESSNEPLGDLTELSDSSLSTVGRDIKNILTNSASAESSEKGGGSNGLPELGSEECSADKCCVWGHVGQELASLFTDGSGCTDPARASVRLGFHDAAAWSKFTGPGGADGSIVLNLEEAARSVNNGLEEIIGQMRTWFDKYSKFGVGMADLIQFAANTGTVMCPGGPRIKTVVGRKDSANAAPEGLLPDVNDPADKLIGLFANKTISAPGLAALVGAHTASKQRFVDPSRADAPQDTTPAVWDVLFYQQTLGPAPAEVFTFASDSVLSKDSRSGPAFRGFADSQPAWNAAFAREYLRMSLLGVENINDLTDCTKALPVPARS